MTKKTLFFCLIICSIISLSYITLMTRVQPIQVGIYEESLSKKIRVVIPGRHTSTAKIVEPITISKNSNLQALINVTSNTGSAPLSVNFNGNSSRGSISSYHWDFGDGETADGATVHHIYTIGGTYTARLIISDDTGVSDIASISLTAKETTEPATQPSAIIGKLNTHGSNPMIVQFDGSKSKTTLPAKIISYAWDFGDGITGTGATITHSFSMSGSYTATLVVTDSNGMTSSCRLPVVITNHS